MDEELRAGQLQGGMWAAELLDGGKSIHEVHKLVQIMENDFLSDKNAENRLEREGFIVGALKELHARSGEDFANPSENGSS